MLNVLVLLIMNKLIRKFAVGFFSIALILQVRCQESKLDHKQEHKANKQMHKTKFSKLVKIFESKDRDNWQKPNLVLKVLGDIKGKTIADLGAGTGYLTFKVSKYAKKVIALDVDDKFLHFMQKKKQKLSSQGQNHAEKVEIRKASFFETNLKANEADILISVNVYHHIEERIKYFSTFRKKSPKTKLFFIDFKPGKLKVGPPVLYKIHPNKIVEELIKVGYKVSIDSKTLPYQVIIIAI